MDSGTQKRMAEVGALVRRLKKPGMQAAWCRAVGRTQGNSAKHYVGDTPGKQAWVNCRRRKRDQLGLGPFVFSILTQ